jgi:hypothetical protein
VENAFETDESKIAVVLSPGDPKAGETLVARLVQQNFNVTHFAKVEPRLEEIFLHLTKGIVA